MTSRSISDPRSRPKGLRGPCPCSEGTPGTRASVSWRPPARRSGSGSSFGSFSIAGGSTSRPTPPRAGACCRWPRSARPLRDRMLIVGDAAGLVKPTTGGGIYYSVVSGRLAAEVLAEQLDRDELGAPHLARYERLWRKRFQSEFDAQLALRRVAEGMDDDAIDALVRAGAHRRRAAARAALRRLQPSSRFHQGAVPAPARAAGVPAPARGLLPSTMLTLQNRVTVCDDVVFRALGEESVILSLDTGMYFGLDPVGTRIWTLLADRDLAGVAETIHQEFERRATGDSAGCSRARRAAPRQTPRPAARLARSRASPPFLRSSARLVLAAAASLCLLPRSASRLSVWVARSTFSDDDR